MTRTVRILLVVLAFVSTEASAQFIPQIGVRAGGNLAQLRGKDEAFGRDDTDRKFGFTAGVFAELPLTAQLSLQPELLYTQKGGRVNTRAFFEGVDGDFEGRYRLNYIELPLLLAYTVPAPGPIKPKLYAGPYVAYSVERRMNFRLESDTGEVVSLSYDAGDSFERWDYGGVVGMDFGYRFVGRAATVGLRYNFGIANVFKSNLVTEDGTPHPLPNPEAHAHELSLMFGFRLF